MRTGTVTAHVRVNAGIFRRFALFDAFRLKRRWVSPAVFCAVFLALSFLCMASGREQSGLIGTLLQVIGLGLPATIPSLGNLINEGRTLMMSPNLRYQLIYPTILLSIVTISFYMIGNAFSDAADPKNHI